MKLPPNDSRSIKGEEIPYPSASFPRMKPPGRQSTLTTQDLGAHETPFNALAATDVKKPEMRGNSSSASPGGRAKETGDTVLPSQPTSSPSQKQETLTSWLKTFKSVPHLGKDKAKKTGRDTQKYPRTNTNKDTGVGPATNSRAATQTASKRPLVTSNAAHNLTFGAPSTLNGAPPNDEQQILDQDALKQCNAIRSRGERRPSSFTLLDHTHSLPLSDRTRQYRGSLADPSEDPFISEPQAAPSSDHGGEEYFNDLSMGAKDHLSPFPLHRGRVSPYRNSRLREASRDVSRPRNSARGDTAASDLRAEDVTAGRPLQPETLARSIDGDRTPYWGASRSEKQADPEFNTYQRSNPITMADVRHNPAPLTFSSTPIPEVRLPESREEGPKDFRSDHAASSSPRPKTPAQHASQFTSAIENEGTVFGSSPPVKQEHDSRDNSLRRALVSPAPRRGRESNSSALIRIPSPGGLDVIWSWTSTDQRKMVSQAFFCIADQLGCNLTPREVSDSYIYALKVKDPRAIGYIKIGTTIDIKSRIQNHKFCYGEVNLIYPPKGEQPVRAKHAGRVEQLIHAELVERALKLKKCPRYRQKHDAHKEWFDVEEHHAIAVIRKWSDWTSTAPYKMGPFVPSKKYPKPKANQTTSWRLKPLEPEVLKEICWPLDPQANPIDYEVTEESEDDMSTGSPSYQRSQRASQIPVHMQTTYEVSTTTTHRVSRNVSVEPN